MRPLALLPLALLLVLPPVGSAGRAVADDEPTPPQVGADDARGAHPAAPLTSEQKAEALREALALNARAGALHQEARFAEAEVKAREALALRERVLGPDHRDVAQSLNNVGILLLRQGSFERALPLLQRALAIWEKALGPDHPEVAAGLANLGALYYERGRYDEAAPLIKRSLSIRERVLGPQHLAVSVSLDHLANLRHAQGAYEEARALFARALAIRERSLGEDHPDVAVSLDHLGVVLRALGAVREARSLCERALAIRERVLGARHPDLAWSLNSLADLLTGQGVYAEARPLYERALAIRRSALGPSHPDVATSLNNLAQLLRAQGAEREAIPLQEEALAIYEKALGTDHVLVATCLNNLALLLEARGEQERAASLYQRAIAIAERTFGPLHPGLATNLNNLALLRQTQRAYPEARSLHARALGIREHSFGPDDPSVAQSLNNLAVVHALEGKHAEAARTLKRALSIYEHHFRFHAAALDPSKRFALARTTRGPLDHWLQLAPHVARTGYEELLRFKGAVVRTSAAEGRLMRRGGADGGARIAALRAAERTFATLANQVPSAFPKAGYEARHSAWLKAFAQAGTERERLSVALARDFAPLRVGLERLDLTLADIQAHLGPDEVLVDTLRSRDRYWAWVVPHTGPVERIDLGPADAIERAAHAFATLTADTEATRSGGWDPSAGRVLRDIVWTPIEKRLRRSVRAVIFAPDAALAVVPFVALPGRSPGRFLVDDYAFGCVSMAQDLVPWPAAEPVGRGALLVGGVDYAAPLPALPVRLRTDRAPRGGRFAPLAATEEEVRIIGRRFGEGGSLLLGSRASEARVRAGAPGKRVLHLATHGFVREDLMRGLRRSASEATWLGADAERQLAGGHDPLNLAGLALAGANARNGGGGDDGILTALEASHLDLGGVDLVVLSACETARGRPESGEGVIGLVQGFQTAGARQVIGSLWKVDDEATLALMTRFHELWAPGGGRTEADAGEALRQAQRHLRAQTKWRHPYYWAAWIVWGVGR